jgi:hypothetical protein
MKKTIIIGCSLSAMMLCLAALPSFNQQKTYKLELTTLEVQLVYDALGELPAKTSESVRLKILKQVTEQNNVTK